MNLRFHNIHINNFFSFADVEVSLDDLGYVLVSGRNNNPTDLATSNGSGKSTIFNALCWALTGETLQGINSNIENIFTDPGDCWVSVEFDVDQDHFYVRRIKTPRPDLKIFINKEDKSGKGIRESSQLLAQYIPELNSKLIGSIIILGQGLPHRFSNNRPAQRKEILENLTKSDFMIDAIKSNLEFRQSELKSLLRQYEDKKIEYDTQIKVYNNQLNLNDKELSELIEFNSEGRDPKEIDKALKEINKECKALNKKIADLLKKVGEIEAEKVKLADIREEKKAQLTAEYNPIITNLQSKVTELFATEKLKKAELKKLKAVTDICPTCGQKIPDVHIIDTTDLEAEIATIEAEREKFTKEHNDKVVEQEEKYIAIVEEYSTNLIEVTRKSDALNEKVNEYSEKLTNTEAEKTRLEELKSKYASYNETFERLTTTKNSLENKLEGIAKLNTANTSNIDKINEHLAVVQNLITLAKREFRGILLQSVIEYINKKVKAYSKEVFETELLSFTLDENYINIAYDNKPYENLSGGEKQKVDIIIQLALRELLSNQLNIHSNILVVDECFDNLDTIGCQKILNLISNLDDVSSVFIITHHKDSLEISYDCEFIVEKNESGISSLYVI